MNNKHTENTHMNIKIETIQPAQAKRWLNQRNGHNRNLRQSHVDYLANEMIGGRFKETAQGISFFKDGTLADGQHRLAACVESGVAIKLPVARGVEKEAMCAYDMGARRSVADFLHLHHDLKDANLVTASARSIVSMCFAYQNYPLSADVILRVLRRYGKELEETASEIKQFKPAVKAWIIGTIAFARKSQPEKVAEFVTAVATGESVKKGHPALTFRNWLINKSSAALTKTYKRQAIESLGNVLFNAVQGQSLSTIRSGVQGIQHFQSVERRFIEEIRVEIAHLISC
jgi:hypothetical protein